MSDQLVNGRPGKDKRRSTETSVADRRERDENRRSTLIDLPISYQNDSIGSNDEQIILHVPQGNARTFFRLSRSSTARKADGGTRPTLTLAETHRQPDKTRTSLGKLKEEFQLPTNPPITVTIQSQADDELTGLEGEEKYLHPDEICSLDDVGRAEGADRDERRSSSFDPSVRGTSTVVNYLMDLLKPSDNKLAMKLFGSRKGLLKERLRQQRAGHCIIHPCSNFRFVSLSSLSPCRRRTSMVAGSTGI